MTKIKNKLRFMGITLAEFANKLNISRPTLDTYIDLYERTGKVPKDKYQTIFDYLFSYDVEDKEIFYEKLDNCYKLLERDMLLGTLDLEKNKTDIITSVIEEMKKDMHSDGFDEDMYVFINMFIRSYKKEEIFKKLARYFLFLNGVKKLEEIKKDEHIYLGNYYKVFYDDKLNKLRLNETYFNLFIQRCKEIKNKEKQTQEKLENILIEKIQEKIKSLLSLGVDINDLDINQLLKDIKFNSDNR